MPQISLYFWTSKTLPFLVYAYALTAAILHWNTFSEVFPMYVNQLIALAPVIVCLATIFLIVKRRRKQRSLVTSITGLLGNFFWPALFMCLGLTGFTTFKLMIPESVPFYLDPMIADLDYMLHGAEPGLVLQRVLPESAAWPIAISYGPIWALVWVGGFFAVAFCDDRELRQRYWWTCALSFLLLGTVLATILSSVGPVYYEAIYGDTRFRTLMSEVYASGPGDKIRDVSDYLWGAYADGNNSFGTGISAMPSMHVAVVTLQTLAAIDTRKILGAFVGAYAAIILVGSVYLGWHYALDGYISIIVVCSVWRVAQLAQRKVRRVKLGGENGFVAHSW